MGMWHDDESGPYHGTGWVPPPGPTMAQTEAMEAEFHRAWAGNNYAGARVVHRESGRKGQVRSIQMLQRTISVVMDDGEVMAAISRPEYIFEVLS